MESKTVGKRGQVLRTWWNGQVSQIMYRYVVFLWWLHVVTFCYEGTTHKIDVSPIDFHLLILNDRGGSGHVSY